MARVVVTNRIPASGLELLREQHEVIAWEQEQPPSREQVLAAVAGADAIVTLLTDRVDGELLDAAGDQLLVVANVAVGYDNLDVAACESRGVVATNTPGVLTDTTADTAFGLMLMATRRFGEAEREVRSGEPWRWGMFYLLGTSLQGKTLGIIGPGLIGIATARRARAFGMEIVYSGRSPMDPAAEAELSATRLATEELLARADVVSVHCPLVPQGRPDSTYHLIDAAALAAMKPTAYLVNTSRGPVVDEASLAAALRDGTIAGAGLDVYEDEPTIHPDLFDLENVVLLPHLGSATHETRSAMADLAARNALAVLSGQEALSPVTRRTT
ncbi:glyoxylate reductase [Kineosphaera limosa]|uniref:Putative glyoxylate reductase n=1 Tax=Kineosphaera limosa NBRC 100340 TaxID=1184609 RepID=K6WTS9_9MICO|nr:D-glycerate dehydrogenase [Kineosphaera limosa]NYD99946.1 glyoxylate reductase [Kineosphaera limosa]GAB95517.1 putative glyoxylate reductase [Kineosphaera limosa NBRC 100340]